MQDHRTVEGAIVSLGHAAQRGAIDDVLARSDSVEVAVQRLTGCSRTTALVECGKARNLVRSQGH